MQVKICGIRTPSAARACVRAGAEFAGLNFVPKAKRSVSPAQAAELIASLKGVEPVGVFRNEKGDRILDIANTLQLSWVQLHGDESVSMCAALRDELRIIKAFSAPCDPSRMADYAEVVDVFLLDGQTPGSGASWDYGQIAGLERSKQGKPADRRFGALRHGEEEPHWGLERSKQAKPSDGRHGALRHGNEKPHWGLERCGKPLWLAGGLTAANVGRAIALTLPDGVDVASGVEHNGECDPQLIVAFCKAARAVATPSRDSSP